MSLMDSLFYWLQMKLVCDERPDDGAARETVDFFARILSEDHGLASFHVERADEMKIYVTYRQGETERTVWFDREAAEQLVRQPIVSSHEREDTKERGQA